MGTFPNRATRNKVRKEKIDSVLGSHNNNIIDITECIFSHETHSSTPHTPTMK